MKQVLILTRMQLGTALEFLNIGRNTNRKKNLSVITVLVLGCALFGFISGNYSFMMGMAMKQFGELDVLPGFFMATTSIIVLITSIYKAKGVLFGFKDYDIVMSLPVKASYIVASRLLLLYTINMIFCIGFLVPSYVVYGILAKPAITFYINGVIALVFVPLIPMILASIVGVILGYISSKFKYSNAMNTVIMFVAFFAIFMVMMTNQNPNQIAKMGTMFTDKMNSTYPLARWFQSGVVGKDYLSLVLFLSVSTLTFVIFAVVLGKCFKRLNSKLSSVYVNSKFKMRELKQSSQIRALYHKEAKRYFSCSIYVFNTFFSLILLVVAAIAIHVVPIKQLDVILSMPVYLKMVKNIAPYAIALMISLCTITASSISLEGKNFWILKAAPVKAETILNAKILFTISLTMPTCLITSISLMFRLNMNLVESVITILLPLIYCYLSAVLGLFVNLKLPMMEWKNETVVVKQSAAALVATFSGFLIVGIPVTIIFTFTMVTPILITLVTFAITILFATSLHAYMNRKGKRFIADL